MTPRERYRASAKGRSTAAEYANAYYHRVLKNDPVAVAKRRRANAVNHYARYGLTPEIARQMKQRGCDLCGDTQGPMNIDHDHLTGRVRGVLCKPCNLTLGYLERAAARGLDITGYIAITRETKHAVG